MAKRVLFLAVIVGVAFGEWGAPLRDLGVSGYDCGPDLMRPSKNIPTNVNSVRPADIKVVMALGDSITAANGAGAEDPLAVVLQYRGLAFAAGGDKTLEEHVTIPNILKKFNPKLFGYSLGVGGQMVWEVAQLNLAFPGAVAADLLGQAQDLVTRLNSHEGVNMKEDWKLLNIFIGGNDMCGYCRHPEYAPANCVDHIKEAVQCIQANIPRTIVNLVSMLHLELLRQVDTGLVFCIDLHTHECGCEQNQNYTNAEIAKDCEEYQRLELQLQDSGVLDQKDDTTFVVQPFFNEIVTPPEYPNGTVDLEFFCPDCFHFSQYGHAVTATWYWRNMMEPVGAKTTKGDFSNPAIPLACPDPRCPFIRTVKNSKDCSLYMTD